MNGHEFEIYIELYKRGEYDKIPIGEYPDGSYFYMTKKQIQAVILLNDDITTDIGYGGSARSGKTIIECTVIIFDCLAYSDIAWGLARRELTTLKRTVLLTLFKQFEFYGISGYSYNQQLNKITFKNKSEIFLIDTAFKPSDPLNTRFGGFELTRSAVDESNETDISVIIKLFERTGWRNNDKYKLKRKQFECFNPSKNHVYSRYYLPFKNKTEPDHKKFIPALPKDNPHPSVKEWMIDLVKQGDHVTIERQINGNFDYDDDPTALIDYENIHNMWSNIHVESGNKYIIADVARYGSDKAVITVWDGFVLVEYYELDISSTQLIVQCITTLQIKYKVGLSNILVDEAGVGGGTVDIVRAKGFIANAKPTSDRYNSLKDECGYKLANITKENGIWFKAEISMQLQEKIETELGQLKTYDADRDGKLKLLPKEKIKENIGHSPDWLDVFIMRMFFEVNDIEWECW